MGFWDPDLHREKVNRAFGEWNKSQRVSRIRSMIGQKLTHPEFPGWEVEVFDYSSVADEVTMYARHPEFPNTKLRIRRSDVEFPVDSIQRFLSEEKKLKFQVDGELKTYFC